MALPLAGLLGRFTSQTASETLGFGVGVALAEALRPEATTLGQDSWRADPSRVVDAELAAAIVAEAVELADWGAAEAAGQGISADRFTAMVGEALNAPGIGELLRLRRRRAIDLDAFHHGLRKARLETRWDAALEELVQERLDPAEIAKAIHRGIMRGAGLLVAEVPETPGRVPIVPPSDIDPVTEAAASGFDEERLRVMVGNAGLPPGIVQMLELLNRGQIEESDFLRGVGESNMRNEWGNAVLALRRRLLTPVEYVQALLRGWIEEPAMREGAALSGMTGADADLLAKLSGRPLSWRQVFIGLRRGGTYDGPTGSIDPAFLKALRESSIRPEWYNLAWAIRYSYPSAFVLRGLAEAGDLSRDDTQKILLFQGWEPELAGKVSARWAGQKKGAGKAETLAELEDEYAAGYMTETELRAALTDLGYLGHELELLVSLNEARRLKRYREKAVDAIAAAYTGFRINAATASSELAELNVTGQGATMLLALWDRIRRNTVRELTEAQVKKAYVRGILSRELALERLEELHYPASDADLLLEE